MNLSVLIGFILPPFIDLLNAKVTNSKLKFWIALGVCFLVSVLMNLDKLTNLEELLGSLGIIFAQSQIVYHTYWEKSEARQSLQNRL